MCRRGGLDAAPPAWAAEVVSSNIVGYQKVNISAGLSILGTPFVDVGSIEGSLNIQNITPANTETAGGIDYLRLWDGSQYTEYFYYSAADEGVDDDGNPGWGDGDQEAVDELINAGSGYWVHSGTSETVTIAGEVTETTEVPIIAGLTLVCNPQPVSINIQDIVPSNTETAGGVDYLRLWDGTQYTEYFYYSSADEGVDDDGNPGWGDDDQEAVDVTIPPGTGFWVHSGTSEVLTFPNALSSGN